MRLPKSGTPWDVLKARLLDAKRQDCDWRAGRLPVYVYYRDEELLRVQCEAFSMFMVENAHGAKTAFPSLRRLQDEVVNTALALFHAPADAGGSFTSGGTESVLLALKTARDRARACRPEISRPNIVVPYSAHPCFNKAAHLLALEITRAPLAASRRADVSALAHAMTDQTILVAASAPAYPHGAFDPIGEIAEVARQRNVWFHVDACFGGFLAPFAKRLGHPIPEFDFSLAGVTSLSADLHKYGFAAKGASLILYRDRGLQQYEGFEFQDWPRGYYSSTTFPGSKPGGAIAAAWAVMNYLGEEGYLEIARTILDTHEALVRGIQKIEGLEIVLPSELSIVVYRSADPNIDIDAVAEGMGQRGWFVSRTAEPKGIHLAVIPIHASVVDAYLYDLKEVAAWARQSRHVGTFNRVTY